MLILTLVHTLVQQKHRTWDQCWRSMHGQRRLLDELHQQPCIGRAGECDDECREAYLCYARFVLTTTRTSSSA